MSEPQPPVAIAEGDVVLVRARVRKVFHDGILVRIAIRDGSSAFHQLSVPPSIVVGREGERPAWPCEAVMGVSP